jgi:hypothetical protein
MMPETIDARDKRLFQEEQNRQRADVFLSLAQSSVSACAHVGHEFYGNGSTEANEPGPHNVASKEAHGLSLKAVRSGSEMDHANAAGEHGRAAEEHDKAGNTKAADHHREMQKFHSQFCGIRGPR